VGAVFENITLRGAELGLRLEPRGLLPSDAAAPLVEFTILETDPCRDDALAGAIEGRHSNRRLRFRGPSLEPAMQRAMSAQAGAVPGTELIWLDDPRRRNAALRLIRLAESERFRNRLLHQEMFESIRFDVGWRASATDGLPPGSLALPWIARPGFTLLRHWGIQRMANILGAHLFLGWRGADLPCRLAPHLCAIAADGDLPAAAVGAGRLLQRVWLHATTLGLGFQVFAASPNYALAGSTAVSTDLRHRLSDGWRALCPKRRPFIVFRMGVAELPACRAGRVDAQHLFVRDQKDASLEGVVP
jgi:hypothetical protein